MVKNKIVLILFLLLASINCLSQHHIPSNDTLRRMFNGDFPKDDESEESILMIKNYAAWLLGEETFILQNIEQAIKDNGIDHNQFLGIAMLVDSKMELPKDKVQNILSIKQLINDKFGTNKAVYNYLMLFDIIAANTYFEPNQIDSLAKTLTGAANNGKLDLEDDVIRNLFDLNVLNFELKKDSITADSFVAEFYKKYPKALAHNYLHYHFNKKNYKMITDNVTTSEPNPFLVIQAAISHNKLN